MVVNEGAGVAVVERATGKKINPAPVQEVASRTPAPENLKPGRRQSEPARDAQPTQRGVARPETAQPDKGQSPRRGEEQPKKDEPVVKPDQPDQPREGGQRGQRGKTIRPPTEDTPRDVDDRGSSRGKDGGGQKERGHGRGGGDGE